jgi:predicted transcriptional regulator of viral defense system
MACARAPGSIVCLHSALRLHGIKSQAAETVWLAVPRRCRVPRLWHTAVRILRFNDSASSFRVRETDIDGVPAYITSPERTVADCFRLTRQAGAEAGPVAFRDALGKGLMDIEELVRIEGVLPCRRLRAQLGRYAQDPFG